MAGKDDSPDDEHSKEDQWSSVDLEPVSDAQVNHRNDMELMLSILEKGHFCPFFWKLKTAGLSD